MGRRTVAVVGGLVALVVVGYTLRERAKDFIFDLQENGAKEGGLPYFHWRDKALFSEPSEQAGIKATINVLGLIDRGKDANSLELNLYDENGKEVFTTRGLEERALGVEYNGDHQTIYFLEDALVDFSHSDRDEDVEELNQKIMEKIGLIAEHSDSVDALKKNPKENADRIKEYEDKIENWQQQVSSLHDRIDSYNDNYKSFGVDALIDVYNTVPGRHTYTLEIIDATGLRRTRELSLNFTGEELDTPPEPFRVEFDRNWRHTLSYTTSDHGDNQGMDRIELYEDGVLVDTDNLFNWWEEIAPGSKPPDYIRGGFNLLDREPGLHIYVARAYDISGQMTESPEFRVELPLEEEATPVSQR